MSDPKAEAKKVEAPKEKSPAPQATAKTEAPPAAAAHTHNPPKCDPDEERVIIRPYPKAIFFYPLMLVSLLCGILASSGMGRPETLGLVWMSVFLFTMIPVAFEITRFVSVAMVLTALVLVLSGVLLNEKFGVMELFAKIYAIMHFKAEAGFYYGAFGSLAIVFAGIVVDTRFDYWELRGNEMLHHHGFLGDVERYPAAEMKIRKEINDVIEYLLLQSGRLVLMPKSNERAIVLENVPRINVLEELITNKLHALKVKIE